MMPVAAGSLPWKRTGSTIHIQSELDRRRPKSCAAGTASPNRHQLCLTWPMTRRCRPPAPLFARYLYTTYIGQTCSHSYLCGRLIMPPLRTKVC